MKRLIIILLISVVFYFGSLYAKEFIYKEENTDYLNYYRNNKSYSLIKNKGIKIINMREEESFFVYWIPPKYTSQRILVALGESLRSAR